MSIIHNNNLTKEKAIEMLESQNTFQMTKALEWLVENPNSYADVEICQHLGILITDTALGSLGEGASLTEEGAERIGFYLKLSNLFETSVKESIRKLEEKTETLTGRVAEVTKNNELVKKSNIALSSQVSHFRKTNEQLQKQNTELSQVQQTLQETRESLAKTKTLVVELRRMLADQNTHQIELFEENSRLRDLSKAIDKTVGEKTEENKLLSKELSEAKKATSDLSNQLLTAQGEVTAQSSKVRTLEQQIKESKRTLESLKLDKDMSEAQVKSAYDGLLKAKNANSDLLNRLSNAQREAQTQSSKIRRLEGQIKGSERTLESLKLEKNLSEAQVKQLETKLAETQVNLNLEKGNSNRLKEFIVELVASEEKLQNENNELTNTLSQKKSDLNTEQAKTQALSSEITKKTAELQKEIDKLQAELLLNKSMLEGKNDQEKVQLNNTRRRLEETKANLETQVKTLRNDLRMVEESAKKTQRELELANTNLKEAQQKEQRLSQELSEAKNNLEKTILAATANSTAKDEALTTAKTQLSNLEEQLKSNQLKAQDNELHLVANNRDLSSQVTNQQAEIDRLRLENEAQEKRLNELMSQNAQQKTIIDQLNSVIGSLRGLVASLWEFICWIKDQSWMTQEGRTAIEIKQGQGNFSEARTIAEELAHAKAEAEAKVKAEAEAQAKKVADAEKHQRKMARRARHPKNGQKIKSEAPKNQEAVSLLSAEEKAEAKIYKQILEAPARNPVRLVDSFEIDPLDEVKPIPQTRREFHTEAKLKLDATGERLSEFEKSLDLVEKKYDEMGFPNKFLGVQARVGSFRNELASINDKLEPFLMNSWEPLNAKDTTFKEEFEELLSKVTQFTETKLTPQTRAEFHAEAKLEFDTIEERLSEFKKSLDLVEKKYDEMGFPNKFLGVQATVWTFQNKLVSINDKLQPFLNSRELLNAEDITFKEEFEQLLSEITRYMSRNKPKIEQLEKKLEEPQEVESVFTTLGSYFGWGK